MSKKRQVCWSSEKKWFPMVMHVYRKLMLKSCGVWWDCAMLSKAPAVKTCWRPEVELQHLSAPSARLAYWIRRYYYHWLCEINILIRLYNTHTTRISRRLYDLYIQLYSYINSYKRCIASLKLQVKCSIIVIYIPFLDLRQSGLILTARGSTLGSESDVCPHCRSKNTYNGRKPIT